MQDIHGILGAGAAGGGGSGGLIFGGDRRLRAAAAQGHHHHLQQVIKCPRCDSSNTKFCYYNNYNLSQPRHFCKNCRRYWTNGGVLRNVPVGGRCRKAKRSSKRKASSPAPPPHLPPSSVASDDHRQKKSDSRSSSESNSVNTGVKGQSSEGVGFRKGAALVTESGSEFSSSLLFKFSEQPPTNYAIQEPTKPDCSAMNTTNFKPLIDQGGMATAISNSSAGAIFTEIGGFASSMSGDQNQNLFGYGASGDVTPAPFRIHHQNQVNHQHQEDQQLMRNPATENWRLEKLDGGDDWGPVVLDQAVQMDLVPGSRSTGGGLLAGSDWHDVSGGGRGNLFDLTPGSSTAQGGGHWSQSADEWHESDHDHDHHLYLPP